MIDGFAFITKGFLLPRDGIVLRKSEAFVTMPVKQEIYRSYFDAKKTKMKTICGYAAVIKNAEYLRISILTDEQMKWKSVFNFSFQNF